MADDAIYRETKQSIDRLFAQVSGGASSASRGLYDVGTASRSAGSGLDSLTDGVGSAARSAGVFVTAVSTMETAVSGTASSMSASAAGLEKALGTTVSSITNKIDEAGAKIGTGTTALIRSLFGGFKGAMAGTSKWKIGDILKGITKGVTGWSRGLLIAGAGFSTLEDYLDDSYESFKYMSKAGVTLGGDLAQVGALAGRSMLSFHELSSALQYAAPALAKFGGMASSGAMTLVMMQEDIMDSVKTYDSAGVSFGKAVRMMGIESKESMSLITEMMGDQVFATKLRGMTDAVEQQKRTQITADYITQLDQLSKLTGKSRETLAKEMKQKAQDAQFAATLMDMDAEQAAAAKSQLAFIENTYGKEASDLFKARLAGVVPTGDGARKLMATSLGSVISDMAGETASQGGSASAGILKAHMGELGAAAAETRDMLKPLALAGGLVGSSFASLFTATNQATLQNQAVLSAMKLEITAMDKLTEAMSKLYRREVGKDEETGAYKKGQTDALVAKASLEHISKATARLIHEIITGIGRQGGDSETWGAGDAFNLATTGAEWTKIGMEKIGNFETWGPAGGGGTSGGGYGSNNYGIPEWMKLGLPKPGKDDIAQGPIAYDKINAKTSQEELIKSILAQEKTSSMILRSGQVEVAVRDALQKRAVSPEMIEKVMNSVKMDAAMKHTGLTQEQIKQKQKEGLRPGPHGTDMKSIREVTGDVINAKRQGMMDKHDDELAKKTSSPIVESINALLEWWKLKFPDDIDAIVPLPPPPETNNRTGDNSNRESRLGPN